MPSNSVIFCYPPLLPSIFPSIVVFSIESVLCIRWPRYWSFSFSLSPSNEYSMISFRIDWSDLHAVQVISDHHYSKKLQCVLGPVQFLTIMMITQITSAVTNLVHIPNKSSVFTDLFNPDPRWGGRCYHLHLWKGNTFSGELNSISAGGEEVKGKNQYNFYMLPHGTADWKDGGDLPWWSRVWSLVWEDPTCPGQLCLRPAATEALSP